MNLKVSISNLSSKTIKYKTKISVIFGKGLWPTFAS